MTMYARVTTVHGDPARADEAIQAFRDRALPMVREAAGFKGSILLVDRASGHGLGISLWESEEAMQATEQAVSAIRDANAAATGGSIPTVERYEVAVYETA
jgi:heme-degrading monooxygenase HmoA